MSKKENVKKIKKYIDEILNTKSSLIAKRPLKQDKLKKLFCNMLTEIQFVNARAVGMKHDYNLDFTEYDEPFFKAIEASIKLQFSEKQKNLINWWLYDKFLPSGEMLVLNELAFVNARAVGMKHDFSVDFTNYDDPFFKTIDSLMKLHFTEKQRSMINWWLYDKFLPTGEVLILNDNDTEEEIPTETAEDIWDLLQELKLKDEEKNPD